MHIGVGKRKILASQQSIPFSGGLSGNACMILFNRCFYRVIRVQVPKGYLPHKAQPPFHCQRTCRQPVPSVEGHLPRHRCCGTFWRVSFCIFPPPFVKLIISSYNVILQYCFFFSNHFQHSQHFIIYFLYFPFTFYYFLYNFSHNLFNMMFFKFILLCKTLYVIIMFVR